METFGAFEAGRVVDAVNGATVYEARKEGDRKGIYAVKVFSPERLLAEEQGETRSELDPLFKDIGASFTSRVNLQKKAAESSRSFAPILAAGHDERGAWYATLFYARSVQGMLERFVALEAPDIFRIVESVTGAALHLKQTAGRSHGNLKPSNIFIEGVGKPRSSRVVVADPLPGDANEAARYERADLRAIGELLYQVVLKRKMDFASGYVILPAESSKEWTETFEKKAEQWLSLCNKLLDPEQAGYSLEQLTSDLAALKPARSAAVIAVPVAAAVILVAGAGLYIAFKPSHNQKATGQPAITLTSDPRGAEVTANGTDDPKLPTVSDSTPLDGSPLELSLPAGKYTFTVSYSNLDSRKFIIDLKSGGTLKTNISLAYGGLVVLSDPPGATFMLEGRHKTPYTNLVVKPEALALNLALDDYESADVRTNVQAKAVAVVSARLVRLKISATDERECRLAREKAVEAEKSGNWRAATNLWITAQTKCSWQTGITNDIAVVLALHDVERVLNQARDLTNSQPEQVNSACDQALGRLRLIEPLAETVVRSNAVKAFKGNAIQLKTTAQTVIARKIEAAKCDEARQNAGKAEDARDWTQAARLWAVARTNCPSDTNIVIVDLAFAEAMREVSGLWSQAESLKNQQPNNAVGLCDSGTEKLALLAGWPLVQSRRQALDKLTNDLANVRQYAADLKRRLAQKQMCDQARTNALTAEVAGQWPQAAQFWAEAQSTCLEDPQIANSISFVSAVTNAADLLGQAQQSVASSSPTNALSLCKTALETLAPVEAFARSPTRSAQFKRLSSQEGLVRTNALVMIARWEQQQKCDQAKENGRQATQKGLWADAANLWRAAQANCLPDPAITNEVVFAQAMGAAEQLLSSKRYEEATTQAKAAAAAKPGEARASRLWADAQGQWEQQDLTSASNYFAQGDYANAGNLCQKHSGSEAGKALSQSITVESNALATAQQQLDFGDYTFVGAIKGQPYATKPRFAALVAQGQTEQPYYNEVASLQQQTNWQSVLNKFASWANQAFAKKPAFQKVAAWAESNRQGQLAGLDAEFQDYLNYFQVEIPPKVRTPGRKDKPRRPPTISDRDKDAYLKRVEWLTNQYSINGWLALDGRQKALAALKAAIEGWGY